MKTHRLLVVGTDKCLSNWGEASGGASYAAWACTYAQYPAVRQWVEARTDMSRVRDAVDMSPSMPYRPKNCAHLHIYVVTDNHPALESLRRTGQL